MQFKYIPLHHLLTKSERSALNGKFFLYKLSWGYLEAVIWAVMKAIKNGRVRKIGEHAILKTRRFTVFDSELRIAGKTVSKPYIRQNDCAEVLAITDSGSVVLVRSYRPELDGYAYELPAGTLKDKEDPKKAAARELEEETGYVAGKLRFLFSGYPLLGYSDCKLHFFLATGLKKRKQDLEDDESIDAKEFKLGEVFSMLRHRQDKGPLRAERDVPLLLCNGSRQKERKVSRFCLSSQ